MRAPELGTRVRVDDEHPVEPLRGRRGAVTYVSPSGRWVHVQLDGNHDPTVIATRHALVEDAK